MNLLAGEPTRCLLVQTRFSEMSFWNYLDVCKIAGAKYPAPPLGLLTVAALLPQDWKFRLVDENVRVLRDDDLDWADIVCTGGMLPQQRAMLGLIERAHARRLPIVLGGPDVTSQPDIYRAADYVVCGEGEVSIPLLLDDLRRGSTGGRYVSEERADMSMAVVPRFDLLRFRDYLQVGIQVSRGCPFNCEFCDVIELYGRASRAKTPTQVTRELQTLYDLGYRGHVDFVDDNFTGNRRNALKVLSTIGNWSRTRHYPFYFSTEATITIAEDEQMLQLMKEADFRFVFIGIETPSDELLAATNKRQNIRKPVADAVKKLGSHGMIVNGGFIVGFDNEGSETADEMIDCIQRSGICMAMVGKLSALPNTQMTKRLHKEGRLLSADRTMATTANDIDQTTGGLNFRTLRPRSEVLSDFRRVVEDVYDPERYYQRVIRTGLLLHSEKKHRSTIWAKARLARSFFRVAAKQGLSRQTGRYFWNTLVTLAHRNPSGLEAAVSLAAMFVHFRKQALYIAERTTEELRLLETGTQGDAAASSG